MGENDSTAEGPQQSPPDTKVIETLPQGDDVIGAIERLEPPKEEEVKPMKEEVKPVKEDVRFVPGADKVARNSWLNRNIAPIIAILILVASFGFFGYILQFDFSEESKLKDIVILLIGIVSTLATMVVSYYFGSSHGSSDKSKFIQNGKK